jgi:hypothetical protein
MTNTQHNLQNSVASESKSGPNFSLITLVLVNLVPLVGVLLLGWSPMEVVYLYWVETAIIGFFNIFKMLMASSKNGLLATIFEKLFMIPFFIVHFGGFIFVQGLFILLANAEGDADPFQGNAVVTEKYLETIFYQLWWPALLLFGSHLFSFFWNFIRQQEYKEKYIWDFMIAPYSRIFVQQFIAILGAVIVIAGGQIWLMIFVIAAKIYADAWAHKRAHQKKN